VQGGAAGKVAAIILFSIIGILGSYGVAWFGIRVNTFANSRTAFASLRGKPTRPTPSRSRPACRSACMLIAVELC
jgi:K(+)-stimulated pyrophosphate-energized sodium pump